ncbi:cupin domain-containing protein [Microbacterium chocolatum]|uniref:cupin domain-containing protein n=1 Tax=Microbacterium aurantiacum TaxID=162393 RepID=UPI00338DCCE8
MSSVDARSGEELVHRVLAGRERAALVDSPACFVGIKAFAPGEVFENHLHEHYDEFLAVLTGEVVVWQGRASRTALAAGTSILCPRGAHHRVSNERDEPASVLYVKTPYVADDTQWVEWTPEADR